MKKFLFLAIGLAVFSVGTSFAKDDVQLSSGIDQIDLQKKSTSFEFTTVTQLEYTVENTNVYVGFLPVSNFSFPENKLIIGAFAPGSKFALHRIFGLNATARGSPTIKS